MSTEFAANLGLIVAETYKLIDEEPDLGVISLAALREKLDSEGLPIDEVIEQLGGLSESSENFLDSFLIQIKPLLDEPSGLQILTDTIDDQGQEISKKIHQLLDESVQSSLSIEKVGGGTGNMKHPWLAVGLTATGVGGTVGLMYKRKVNQLERLESHAVVKSEQESEKLAKFMFSDEQHLLNLKPEGYSRADLVQVADKGEITLLKEVSRYTDKEVENLLKPFAEGATKRFKGALEGAEAQELQIAKRKLVEKDLFNAAEKEARRFYSDPINQMIVADRQTAYEERIQKNIDDSIKDLTSDKVLFDKYIENHFLSKYRNAFEKAAKDEGKVVLDGIRTEIDAEINDALEKAEITAKRDSAAVGRNLAKIEEERLAAEVIKVEENTVKKTGNTFDDLEIL
jgi:hypothetical protein